MIVAIDGPAGSGKSTVACEISRRYGFTKLDTGALYRAVAFCCADRGIDIDDEQAVTHAVEQMDVRFDSAGSETRVYVDGVDVTGSIRTPEVDRIVSKVSAYPGVRRALLEAQRRVAEGTDVVAEGRDIGTVVFPQAQLKVFLTADPRERARRRTMQRHEGQGVPESELQDEIDSTLADIERRDAQDSSREAAPLVAAPDAIKVDSSSHTIEEVVDTIGSLITERR